MGIMQFCLWYRERSTLDFVVKPNIIRFWKSQINLIEMTHSPQLRQKKARWPVRSVLLNKSSDWEEKEKTPSRREQRVSLIWWLHLELLFVANWWLRRHTQYKVGLKRPPSYFRPPPIHSYTKRVYIVYNIKQCNFI